MNSLGSFGSFGRNSSPLKSIASTSSDVARSDTASISHMSKSDSEKRNIGANVVLSGYQISTQVGDTNHHHADNDSRLSFLKDDTCNISGKEKNVEKDLGREDYRKGEKEMVLTAVVREEEVKERSIKDDDKNTANTEEHTISPLNENNVEEDKIDRLLQLKLNIQIKEGSCVGGSLKKEEDANFNAEIKVKAGVVEGADVEKVILTGRQSTLTNIDTRRYEDDINADISGSSDENYDKYDQTNDNDNNIDITKNGNSIVTRTNYKFKNQKSNSITTQDSSHSISNSMAQSLSSFLTSASAPCTPTHGGKPSHLLSYPMTTLPSSSSSAPPSPTSDSPLSTTSSPDSSPPSSPSSPSFPFVLPFDPHFDLDFNPNTEIDRAVKITDSPIIEVTPSESTNVSNIPINIIPTLTSTKNSEGFHSNSTSITTSNTTTNTTFNSEESSVKEMKTISHSTSGNNSTTTATTTSFTTFSTTSSCMSTQRGSTRGRVSIDENDDISGVFYQAFEVLLTHSRTAIVIEGTRFATNLFFYLSIYLFIYLSINLLRYFIIRVSTLLLPLIITFFSSTVSDYFAHEKHNLET